MTKDNKKRPNPIKKQSKRKSFTIIHPNAAGIDVGSEEHWVAVPEDRDEQPVRSFKCFTADLNAMADWLKSCHIQTVVGINRCILDTPVPNIGETRI
jgi:transposase